MRKKGVIIVNLFIFLLSSYALFYSISFLYFMVERTEFVLEVEAILKILLLIIIILSYLSSVYVIGRLHFHTKKNGKLKVLSFLNNNWKILLLLFITFLIPVFFLVQIYVTYLLWLVTISLVLVKYKFIYKVDPNKKVSVETEKMVVDNIKDKEVDDCIEFFEDGTLSEEELISYSKDCPEHFKGKILISIAKKRREIKMNVSE
ncbi:hypothetical protein [Virgibacillus sp. DJP39]|uniref:hypothetical protein n=1 Tax=Virgibacillus sp. DJP39 TaxID=3409790 RepID=UPI003BB80948